MTNKHITAASDSLKEYKIKHEIKNLNEKLHEISLEYEPFGEKYCRIYKKTSLLIEDQRYIEINEKIIDLNHSLNELSKSKEQLAIEAKEKRDFTIKSILDGVDVTLVRCIDNVINMENHYHEIIDDIAGQEEEEVEEMFFEYCKHFNVMIALYKNDDGHPMMKCLLTGQTHYIVNNKKISRFELYINAIRMAKERIYELKEIKDFCILKKEDK